MRTAVVLGGGMVGGFMARTLARGGEFGVILADRDPAALERNRTAAPMETVQADLSDLRAVAGIAARADIVIGAVPGRMGYRIAETVLEAGKDMVDISFFPEDPYELDGLAREKGLTAIVDCGVMPGLGGMLAARLASGLDRADSMLILVGGLPSERRWPMEYKAPFSPADVIEEYVRPARFRRDGRIVVRPALSDPELVDLPVVGTLEAFNTDGLRTLLRNMDVPDMAEKTLRYPGHIEKMRMLRELGFFSSEPVELAGVAVRPLDLTARLLFEEWRLGHGEPEFTVMRVVVEGERDGRRVRETADLLERTDPVTGDSSMARTTGMPAVVMARLLAGGRRIPRGIVAPETLAGDDALFTEFLDGLDSAGIRIGFSSSPA
jgi:lysine 6-dehydrogenase